MCLAKMLDASLPLTPPECLEWGDPIHDNAAFETSAPIARSITCGLSIYPAILALAGPTDPRVTYWESAK